MNILQRPRPREFCATMQDYVIDTATSIAFSVQYAGSTILEEEYAPDAQSQVRIRRLGTVCAPYLSSAWCDSDTQPQEEASGAFAFAFNGVKDMDCEAVLSFLQTAKQAAAPGVLSEAAQKVTRPGRPEYVSGYVPQNGAFTLTGTLPDGSRKSASIPLNGHEGKICTVAAGYERACSLLGAASLSSYTVAMDGGAMEFLVDATPYREGWVFRFKNVYGMPETICCTGGLSVAGGSEEETAMLHGVERKFSLTVADEYTANSGPIFLQGEYKLWHNLLNAREVEIQSACGWLPVIITKQKMERELRRPAFSPVEFTFRMADPLQNNLLAPP